MFFEKIGCDNSFFCINHLIAIFRELPINAAQ